MESDLRYLSEKVKRLETKITTLQDTVTKVNTKIDNELSRLIKDIIESINKLGKESLVNNINIVHIRNFLNKKYPGASSEIKLETVSEFFNNEKAAAVEKAAAEKAAEEKAAEEKTAAEKAAAEKAAIEATQDRAQADEAPTVPTEPKKSFFARLGFGGYKKQKTTTKRRTTKRRTTNRR